MIIKLESLLTSSRSTQQESNKYFHHGCTMYLWCNFTKFLPNKFFFDNNKTYVIITTWIYWHFSDLNNRNQTNSSITDVLCPNNPNHNHPGADLNSDPQQDYQDQNNGDNDWGIFTPKTAPLYLLILLPVVSLKSATFFTKFNAIGKKHALKIYD